MTFLLILGQFIVLKPLQITKHSSSGNYNAQLCMKQKSRLASNTAALHIHVPSKPRQPRIVHSLPSLLLLSLRLVRLCKGKGEGRGRARSYWIAP